MTMRKFFTTTVVAMLAATWMAAGAWARGGEGRPPVPGKSGATGGDLLKERQARNTWLRERGTGTSQGSSRTTPTAPRPAPAPAPGRVPQPAPAPTPDTSLVHLHHGRVQIVGDLARVDLTLEVQNVGEQDMEWRRAYAIDPAAEIIGAVLLRRNELPLQARTLTSFDAFRCYARVRTPPPTRAPTQPRDPLLVARPEADRLEIQIWPIAANETIRVELTFVTPLRGHGARRTYVDVMGGPARGERPAPRLTQPDPAREREPAPSAMIDAQADWLVQPGDLVLSSGKPSGMNYSGEVGGRLQFSGIAATRSDQPAPTVPFLARTRSTGAIYVGSGSFLGRVAMFRFDPREVLQAKGFVLSDGLTAHLVAVAGSTRHLVPASFGAYDEPRPVTAEVVDRAASEIRYRLEVRGRDDQVVVAFDEVLPLRRDGIADELEDAITGWHRAQLARHTFRWAGADARHREAALRYAVDLGVLVPGTAALAIPAGERGRLTPRMRRIYLTDGVPLGARRGEADLKQAPRGAFDDK